MTTALDSGLPNSVAIIGMSGRFPGARDLTEFWNNLKNGVESISFLSPEDLAESGADPKVTNNPDYVNACGILDDIELFDAAFFGFNAREAETLDPQQRLLLECAWHAMEDAGYDSEKFEGPIGVYAGAGLSTYLFNLLSHPQHRDLVGDFQVFTGNDKDFLTTRISYKLNLKGPSMAVQCACSTSLVAVAQACDSLLNHQCDMALAGGVAIRVPQKSGYIHQEGQIFSRDGHTRSFDAAASGTIFSNGLGLVVLKRLEDAINDGDSIRAVIRGWAVNNDGSLKVGYAAPSLDAQAEVVASALALADLDAPAISYVEAHGTATPMGDPIEIAALTKAFRFHTEKKNFCAIGSVKSNVGHLDIASGVAALIKTVLALEHGEIPPTINFTQPNPRIDFSNSPFFVNTKLSPWKGQSPRRAGVHSFAIGGTNAHVVLEEAPAREHSESPRDRQLLIFSARSASAIQAATGNFANYFRQHPEQSLADAAYTCHVGRREFAHRKMLVCANAADALASLEHMEAGRVLAGTKPPADPSLVFMFPGQGTQFVKMGSQLYRTEPSFLKHVDECSELLKTKTSLGFDLREVLYPTTPPLVERAAAQLKDTGTAELALFVFEYALAQLWMEWGIRPKTMIGQSIGEYVAACLAGVFSLPDALSLLAVRRALLQKLPPGAMSAVPLSATDVTPILSAELEIAAINGPSECVVAGAVPALDKFEAGMARNGTQCLRLQIAHALHCTAVGPILAEFTAALKKIILRPPQIPFVSGVTGTWITASAATDPTYWATQLRQPVRFADGMACLLNAGGRTLLEVGPGQGLTGIVQPQQTKLQGHNVVASMPSNWSPQTSETESMLIALGRLWLLGAKPDWRGFWKHERRLRIPLPTYAFDRKRYWVDRLPQGNNTSAASEPISREMRVECAAPSDSSARPMESVTWPEYVAPKDDIERRVAQIWQNLLGVERVGIYDNFFALGGHSMQGAQLLALLRTAFLVAMPLPTLFEAPTVAGMAERIRALR